MYLICICTSYTIYLKVTCKLIYGGKLKNLKKCMHEGKVLNNLSTCIITVKYNNNKLLKVFMC